MQEHNHPKELYLLFAIGLPDETYLKYIQPGIT